MKKQQTERQRFATPALALALIVFAALACGNSGNNSTGGGSNQNTAPKVKADLSTVDLSTPTKSFAAYQQALKNEDVNLYKKVRSKEVMDILAGMAKNENKSLDEFIQPKVKLYTTYESRNEKIDGDKATLEVGSDGHTWSTVSFVKEDDGWKLNDRNREEEKYENSLKKTAGGK